MSNEELQQACAALEEQLSEAESQLVLFQNLYSASIQFLGARTPQDIVRIVSEVMENLLGATGFSMFFWRSGERGGRPLLTKGSGKSIMLTPAVSEALSQPRPTVLRHANGQTDLAVAPLLYQGKLVGAVVIDELLPQKNGQLGTTDLELLEMLSAQAAPALLRARERARAESANQTVEKLLDPPVRSSDTIAVQGDLDETEIPDVVQLVAITRKSGRLELADRLGAAQFLFKEGKLYAAQNGKTKLPVKDAPALLAAWVERAGTFCFYAEPAPTTAVASMTADELVMEALRLYDERGTTPLTQA